MSVTLELYVHVSTRGLEPVFSKNNFFLVLIFCISLISCSKKDNYIKRPEKLPPLDVLYKEAFNSYETNQWSDSVELFQKVESRYSFSEWAPKATLMIMYIYYESGEYFKAVEYAKKFKKLYPLSSDLDYVEFIIGLCFYEKIETIARDQSNSEFALKKFNAIFDIDVISLLSGFINLIHILVFSTYSCSS